uniref:TNF receptor-associated factor 2-like n=1 Tax=Saccoglossus kowalevskii TaxID=10224 RepID=A0ABM0GPD1_SACKO|nr:PREDICTED: TNF receptor-associated factor 2-like [Saccoglossus kowalevskii]
MAQIFLDRAIAREMRVLNVLCVNSGCTWTGYFREYEGHVDSCKFELIICSLEGCTQLIQRQHLEKHTTEECYMRMVKCTYCDIDYSYNNLKIHQNQCPKMKVSCDLCGVALLREKIEKHKDITTGDCTKKRQPCEYEPIGCTIMVEEGQQSVHNKNEVQHHLELLRNSTVKSKDLISRIQNDRAHINELNPIIEQNRARIGTIQQRVKECEVSLQRNAKYVSEGNSNDKLKDVIDSKQKQIKELLAKLIVLERKVNTYEGMVAVLSREMENNDEKLRIIKRQENQIKQRIKDLENKCRSQDRIIALKDVSLAEQDLRIQLLEMTTYDGVLVWKISDFARKRRDAISGRTTSIYSPHFFTSPYGYKLCARVYLNGDGMGKGNHVSLFFVVMKGEYDAILKWPFRQKVTLMWLDQSNREHVIDAFRPDPSSSSFKRPTGDMNIASGCPLFMPLNALDRGQSEYVKDDVAFIRIIVDTTDLIN